MYFRTLNLCHETKTKKKVRKKLKYLYTYINKGKKIYKMPCCVAVNCSNRSEGFRLFRFPTDNIRRQQWLQNLNRKSWIPTKTSYLCEKHFEESQFESGRADNWRKLKPNAIPTLFNTLNPSFATAEPNTTTIADEKDIADEYIMLKLENEHLREQLKVAKAIAKQGTEDDNKALRKQVDDLNAALQTFLTNDQIEMLLRGRLRHWPNESIIKSLKFRFALSVNGYNFLRSTGYPLPDYSTIMRRVQDFKLNVGIFDDVLELLRFKVETMDPSDKYCLLSYDEMVISEQLDYDKNSGKSFGYTTLGGISNIFGTKIFLVLLRGLKNHWKQVIACHVMPKESIDVQVLKEFILQCISSVEDCGFYILALSSDLDNKNRSLWNSLGINIYKSGTLVNSFMFHEHEIFAIPDVCHILKNLKSAMLRQKIYLPDAFVEHDGLPTNIIDGTYVKSLWHNEINNNKEIRRLHHLRREDIDPSQFDKMNVGAAIRFFSPKTISALEMAVEEKLLPKDALTTAAFIRLIYEWFSLVSSKVRKSSITLRNCDQKYIFLHTIIDTFRETVFEKNWKPLNYALVLSTLSFCDMVEFLFKNGFDFVLGHRFTQDATENIFSQIRNKEGKMPTALKCLRAIKSISVSQFVSNVKHTSYCNDSDNFLLDFCKSKKKSNCEKASPTLYPAIVDKTNILRIDEIQICTSPFNEISSTISDYDAKCLFYLAGSTTNAVMKHICEHCIAFVLRKNLPDNDFIRKAKLYTSALNYGGLKEPCLETFYVILHCDYVFKTYRDHILKYGTFIFIEHVMKNTNIVFPNCCDVKTKIVKHFMNIRSYCVKNFSENSRKRKNIYGTASLKRSKA